MTHFEYDLATRAVLGLFGCAYILVAFVFDWHESGWDYRALHWNDRTTPIETLTFTSETLVSLDTDKVAAAVERQLLKERKA